MFIAMYYKYRIIADPDQTLLAHAGTEMFSFANFMQNHEPTEWGVPTLQPVWMRKVMFTRFQTHAESIRETGYVYQACMRVL